MPEGVPVGVADRHVGVDSRTQAAVRSRHRARSLPRAADDEPRAARGGDPQRLLASVPAASRPGQQQIPQRHGQLGADRAVGVHQGLGEQLDTAAALVHRRRSARRPGGRPGCPRAAPRPGRGTAGPAAGGHPLRRASPASSGRSRSLRFISSDLNVTTEQHARLPDVRTRKLSRSQVERSAQCTSSTTRTTGCCSARVSSRVRSTSKRRARAVPGSAPAGGVPKSGSSTPSSPAVWPGSSPATSAAPRAPDQPAQGRGERRVGQAARTQLDTAPGENHGAVRHRRGELCDQPRLAASGFRAGQHRARRTARRIVERASQQHELSLSARENRAHQASGHVPHDASPGSRAPPRCDPVRTAGP